jgi:hypothetical protein
VAGCCEHGNGHLGFIKGGEFHDPLAIVNFTEYNMTVRNIFGLVTANFARDI